jgi:hypothetical protein
MRIRTSTLLTLAALLSVPMARLGAAEGNPANSSAQYADWQHSGSVHLLTTPEGANLPGKKIMNAQH